MIRARLLRFLSSCLLPASFLLAFLALLAAIQPTFGPLLAEHSAQPASAQPILSQPDTAPARPTLVLSAPDIQDSQADIGEVISLRVTIENQGQGAAHNLVLRADGEEFFADALTEVDELGAGETLNLSLPLTVTGRSAEGGFILLSLSANELVNPLQTGVQATFALPNPQTVAESQRIDLATPNPLLEDSFHVTLYKERSTLSDYTAGQMLRFELTSPQDTPFTPCSSTWPTSFPHPAPMPSSSCATPPARQRLRPSPRPTTPQLTN